MDIGAKNKAASSTPHLIDTQTDNLIQDAALFFKLSLPRPIYADNVVRLQRFLFKDCLFYPEASLVRPNFWHRRARPIMSARGRGQGAGSRGETPYLKAGA